MPALRSLRLRLMLYATVVVLAALVITGIGLARLFERHAERRVGQELDVHLAQLVGELRFDAEGRPSVLRQPADPRFQQIFGGLYWQITDVSGQPLLRSRSLWDSEMKLDKDQLQPGELHVHKVPGPTESTLLVHEKVVSFPSPQGERQLRISVAIDTAETEELVAAFTRDFIPALMSLGVVLLLGFAVQVSAGLRPMRRLREQITAIREGRQSRLKGPVPSEIAPLAEEMNELLENQEREMVRARDRAADMAHGLKTPLTALATDVRRLREKGETEIAADIEDVASRMRRHMERELARARLRHGRARLVALAPVVSAVVRTLRRTPQGERLAFEEAVPEDLRAPIDQDDLAELLGNLVENATRHAQSRIRLGAAAENGGCRLVVEDDGPGIPEAKRPVVAGRGGRLDSSGAGAGLGLAIVSDILTAYGGRLELGASPLGGLRATCHIPLRPGSPG